MTALSLTQAEVIFLSDMIGPFSKWPPEERAWAYQVIPFEKRTDNSCGPMLRLKLLAAFRHGMRSNWDDEAPPLSVDFSLEELWLIEAILAQMSVRRFALVDEQPLLSFAVKVWDALIDEYRDEIPEGLLSQPRNYSAANALDEVDRVLRQTSARDNEDEHE